jgi:putative alpha-1,2-mannosidase
VSAKNIYIQKVLLNGKECEVGYVTHAQILAGGTLEFMMADKPGRVFSMQ